MPDITVIVPVYNVEAYLHRCVDSILSQTYRDFQLILVDDGSPDNSGAICDDYAGRDPRVVVIHQENGGLSAARNAGIDWAFANGDSQWLFFVDSDDFIHPKTLELLLDAAERHHADISIGGFARTSGDIPAFSEADLIPQLWNTKDFFLKNYVNAVIAWGKLYKKELFRQIRYPVGRLHEDEFTTYKFLFLYRQVPVIPAPLYGYFINENGIMQSGWSPRRMDAIDAFKERLALFKQIGDRELCDHAVRCLANNYAGQSVQAREFPKLQRKMKKQLRRTLLRYSRVFSFIDDFWLFDIAFPRISHRIRTVILSLRK